MNDVIRDLDKTLGEESPKRRIDKSKIFLVAVGAAVGLLIGGLFFGGGGITGAAVFTESQVEDKVDAYLANALSSNPNVQYTIGKITDGGNLYLVDVTLTSAEGSQEAKLAVTKDGRYLILQFIELEETSLITGSTATQPSVTASSEEIATFVACLKEANFKIYGANWCGWTNKLVTMFGGFDAIKEIYVECTENEELCNEAGVEGYPTITINNQKYEGARTFEAFAEATSCTAPSGEAVASGEDDSGSTCN